MGIWVQKTGSRKAGFLRDRRAGLNQPGLSEGGRFSISSKSVLRGSLGGTGSGGWRQGEVLGGGGRLQLPVSPGRTAGHGEDCTPPTSALRESRGSVGTGLAVTKSDELEMEDLGCGFSEVG